MNVVRIGPDGAGRIAPLFDAYRRFYGREPDPALALAFLEERLGNGESVVLAAFERGGGTEADPVGFTQLYPSFSSVAARRIWVLNDLFVVPEARGRGAGRALLEAARSLAESSGAAKLVLATAPDNTPAQRLYESMRWRRDPFFHYYLEV